MLCLYSMFEARQEPSGLVSLSHAICDPTRDHRLTRTPSRVLSTILTLISLPQVVRSLNITAMADMEVDTPALAIAKGKSKDDKDGRKRFEVKKVRYVQCQVRLSSLTITLNLPLCVIVVECSCLVGLGSVVIKARCIGGADRHDYPFLDIVVDNCAICRNHIMDLCTPFVS